jgi:xanthine dehydrogenase YagS FAD-binding subunit
MASVSLTMDGDAISDAKIYLHGVAPVPWRSRTAERAITNKRVTIETAALAGEAAVEGAAPLSMNAYKIPMTKTVVKRALLAAVGNRYWEEA